MHNYHYAYLVGVGLFTIPWLALWYKRKDLHREMVVMGVICGLFAVATEALIFSSDYWHPEWILSINSRVGIEDFLYGFIVGGIASVIYEWCVSLKTVKFKRKKRTPIIWLTIPFFTLLFSVFLIPTFAFQINSIYSSSAALIVTAVFIYYRRRDLLADILISGAIMTVLTIIIEIILLGMYPHMIERLWNLPALSGYSLLRLPIEEYISAFTVGMVVGPAYEYFRNLRLSPATRSLRR